ncbi:DUF192 domain-containing protein [Pseudomonas caspiana]|uniref:DUF192 domain-containing protein n=1 Tax=Pseudomonas caspiana TaxID=1451454 RepID=A0A1Y3P7V3_9PSED|nr:DUF192 domain-containing protein [Pseudomonas caspiana]OUM75908.1 hypothetical protein AUC60_02075 [Pseudomonas caspiana]
MTVNALKAVALRGVTGLLLVWVSNIPLVAAAEVTELCDLTFTGNIKLLNVPVARTWPQQSKGLSYLDDVGPGMLFAYESAGTLSFWMRNTWVPLSIAYISEDGRVFKMEDMEPDSADYHLSEQPAKYALEVMQGQLERKGIAVGSRLENIECRARSQRE